MNLLQLFGVVLMAVSALIWICLVVVFINPLLADRILAWWRKPRKPPTDLPWFW